ncbi:MAG: DUF2726 domain-containing protein [Candidatus Saccharimonas sp.]
MGILLGFAIVIIILVMFIVTSASTKRTARQAGPVSPYVYVRKQGIMTSAEVDFYKRLQQVVGDRYLIFPQIHLSSLATNKTTGSYWKAGFQRLNRRSVDYVLVDPETLQAVYAVELDDKTHDTEKSRAADTIKTEILQQIGLPLVRFRNVYAMSDDEIISNFKWAHERAVQD